MDDATSAVDQETNTEIQDALVKARRNRTTIIISQRVPNIMDCDQIIVMQNGQITARGTHTELVKVRHFTRNWFKPNWEVTTLINLNGRRGPRNLHPEKVTLVDWKQTVRRIWGYLDTDRRKLLIVFGLTLFTTLATIVWQPGQWDRGRPVYHQRPSARIVHCQRFVGWNVFF